MLWVDVLNRALEWRDGASLARAPHAATVLLPGVGDAVRRDVGLLRRVFASIYLDVPFPDAQHKDARQWLGAVTVELVTADETRIGAVLRARRADAPHPEPFESLLSSALVQLLGQAEEPGALTAVHRCHGIHRLPAGTDLARPSGGAQLPNPSGGQHVPRVGEADPPPWPADLEASFAHRAGLDTLLPDPTLRQCGRLVVSERGSRYCSKACSNANFAVRKSRREPRYFAQKQERYRRRKEERPEPQAARVDRGAFVYMD